jgi:hypothetical protein
MAGDHALTATATDNDGATTTSAVVNLTFNTNQFPQVTIATPTNGQSFLSRTDITIESLTDDADGVVRLVEVFANTNKLGELTNTPYVLTWSNVTHGTYVLTSVATDDRGAMNTSVPVEINVIRLMPIIILSNPSVALGEFSFSFTAMEEWNYRVECRDPGGPTNWMTVTTLPGGGATVFVTNAISTNLQKFFRVVAE